MKKLTNSIMIKDKKIDGKYHFLTSQQRFHCTFTDGQSERLTDFYNKALEQNERPRINVIRGKDGLTFEILGSAEYNKKVIKLIKLWEIEV